MSSFDRRTFLTGACAALMAPALTGCGFTPAYAPGGAASRLQNAVTVMEPDGRAGYLMTRELEDRLGRASIPRYDLIYSLELNSQPVAISTQDAHINRLLDYLREHLAESHTIDDLAARTAMSRRTFTRHFQKATGMTVMEWLVSERLRRGRELLETTSLSVEAISERIGFHTATSFRLHFKQRHHVSPRDWRRTFGDVV